VNFFFIEMIDLDYKKKIKILILKWLHLKKEVLLFFQVVNHIPYQQIQSNDTRITMAVNFNGEYSTEFKPVNNPSPFEKL
jgi:hypothetical protein